MLRYLIGFLIFHLLFILSCNNEPGFRKLKVGEKVTILPKKKFSLSKEPKKYKNVFMLFSMGSKALAYSDKTKVEIYYKSDKKEPKFVFDAARLKHMHDDTNCDDNMKDVLTNSHEGDAVFCNRYIDITQIDRFRAIRENKSNKKATSFSILGVIEEYDLIKIGVGFY